MWPALFTVLHDYVIQSLHRISTHDPKKSKKNCILYYIGCWNPLTL